MASCEIAKGEKNGSYTLLINFMNATGDQYSPTYNYELLIVELNLTTLSLQLKQSIKLDQSYSDTLTYITKNGKYLALSAKNSQFVTVYSRKDSKYEFQAKFWNFTQGPSDIYVSQDMSFVAVANKFINLKDDRFNIASEQIAFFYKCNVPNCQQCSWSGVCSSCIGYSPVINGKCIDSAAPSRVDEDEKWYEKPKKSANHNGYQAQLQESLVFLSFILLLIFIILFFLLKSIKKICNYCGYSCVFCLFEKQKKNELELNEETIDVETMNPISSEINKATN